MVKYEKLDTEELIRLSREGDDGAFSEIVVRYSPMLNKVVSGFSSAAVGRDEAFSEACVALYKAVLSYAPERCGGVTFGLYARICAKRRLFDFFAAEERKAVPEGVDADELEGDEGVESLLILKEKAQKLICVARELLSDYEYRVFLLYLQGYDTASMCEELSRDKKSVENAKARMLKTIRANAERFSDI